MNSAIERLLSLRVSHVMHSAVITVSANQMMAEAAEVFSRHRISGAPVVDEHGRCVGILSANDFVRRESNPAVERQGVLAGGEHSLVGRSDSVAGYSIEHRCGDLVRNWMTSAVQTVAEDATIMEAARVMCAGHIHRLPVLHRQQHPVGILTSLDIVAAMLHAVEE